MKARGTLIRRSPLTETSLIVHWCTHENGIVKTVAKGARRPKSVFAGKLDLFFLCEVEIHPSKSGELHILKDLTIERARLGLRRNYLQTLTASYFVKLVGRVAELETPLPEIADLLDRGLNYLEENEADWRAILHFEKQLSEFLGVSEPGVDPIRSLDDIFGKMPEQRNEIEEMLLRRNQG
ncbi:MAG: recombination protein O N-terminal domain-containing protein [Verrucomicrobiota bacterium]